MNILCSFFKKTTGHHPMGKTWLGIGCGIAAGALWGLVFLVPKLAQGFTPLQLSTGRYLVYGLLSIILVAPRWKKLIRTLGLKEWRVLVWLSISGSILFYIFLTKAVQLGGIAMTSLVIGFIPVMVTFIGSRDRGAVPLTRLAPSLLMGVVGISCIAWQAMNTAGSGSKSTQLFGLFCAIAAVVCWTIFAVMNNRWLAQLHHISAQDWNLLTGVVTGFLTLLLVIPAFFMGSDHHSEGEWINFWIIVAGIAILASIAGNAFWNQMNRLLPLTLAGQMFLFETLFALLYGFLWEQRLPTLLEILAIILVMTSVLLCISAHKPRVSTC